MNQSVRTAGALALGALIVAVAALAVRPAPVVGAPATGDQPALHTITVTGTGKITLVPDIAHVGVGISITRSTVKAARDDAATAMTAIIAALKALGVDDKDLQTVGLSLYPQYGPNGTTKVTGYSISEQLQVTVRDLDKTGDVVDAATAAGATDINGISFDVADQAKAMDDARAAAIRAAKTTAGAMAGAAGVNLGAVVSIGEASVAMPGPWYATAGAVKSEGDVATPVQVGTQDLSATVTVVFEID
jgi:uncharacterized protein